MTDNTNEKNTQQEVKRSGKLRKVFAKRSEEEVKTPFGKKLTLLIVGLVIMGATAILALITGKRDPADDEAPIEEALAEVVQEVMPE